MLRRILNPVPCALQSERYLDTIMVFRFYFRCSKCGAEITMKTDPKNSDYTMENGASRNHEPWREKDKVRYQPLHPGVVPGMIWRLRVSLSRVALRLCVIELRWNRNVRERRRVIQPIHIDVTRLPWSQNAPNPTDFGAQLLEYNLPASGSFKTRKC